MTGIVVVGGFVFSEESRPHHLTCSCWTGLNMMLKADYHSLVVFLMCLLKVISIRAQCKRPSVEEDRLLTFESDRLMYSEGDTAVFQCSVGYRPESSRASRVITCLDNKWTDLKLRCKKKKCGPLPDIHNGRYIYSPEGSDGILFGATATAQCDSGYQRVGLASRHCLDSGWDGRDPICEAAKCLGAPQIENGELDEYAEEEYAYGRAVSYHCYPGFTLFGESTITCSEDGTFQPSPPRCRRVSCVPPFIQNAYRIRGRPPYGYKSTIELACVFGYKMNQTGYLVCEENGWNLPVPYCIAQCNEPHIRGNRDLTPESVKPIYSEGDTASFKCSDGYEIVDPRASTSITCSSDRTWTNLELQCKKKSCGFLPEIRNGTYTYSPEGVEGRLFGATATAWCDKGYRLDGKAKRHCQDFGWDGREPICKVVRCLQPPQIRNGELDELPKEEYVYGDSVSYRCDPDFTLFGESILTCSEHGTFWPSPPRCKNVSCERPIVKNGQFSRRPSYIYKSEIEIVCETGYKLDGPGSLVCEEEGWSPPPPHCIGQCEKPNIGENIGLSRGSNKEIYSDGDEITFQCLPGYQPVDTNASRSITCSGTNWTKLELQCLQKCCGPLPEIQNGIYSYSPEGYKGILYNGTATAKCDKGYQLVGEANRYCRDSGWDGENPTCEEVSCQLNIDHSDTINGTATYKYKSSIEIVCKPGYTLDGPGSLVCEEKGWNPPPPRCFDVEKVSCQLNIDHSDMINETATYKYKSSVEIVCKPGYTLDGPGSLVCEEKGWNPPPPRCFDAEKLPTTTPAPTTKPSKGLLPQQVKVQSKVVSNQGQDVILQCHFPDPGETSLVQVSWFFQATSHVDRTRIAIAVFNPSFGVSYSKSPVNGRVTFVDDPPQLQNSSIQIKNIKTTDKGKYTCEYATFPSGSVQGITNLSVTNRKFQ